MSAASQLASQATHVDWNLVAAAAATFLGTLVVTVWGWINGRKKLNERLERSTIPEGPVTGAVLLDNMTLREATLVNREVRDQLLLHSHAMGSLCKATEENTGATEDLMAEIKKVVTHLKDVG